MSYFKKGFKGSVIILLTSLLAALFGFLIRIFLANTISLEEYGLFYSMFTFFMFIGIFTTLGYGQSLIKFIPEFQVQKRKDLIDKTVLYVLIISLALRLIFIFAIVLLADYLTLNYFKVPLARPMIYLFCIFFFINTFNSFMRAFFNAFQDMLKSGIIYFLRNFLTFIFIIVFFYFGLFKGALLPTYATITSFALGVLIFVPFVLKKLKPIKSFLPFDKALFKKLTLFAFPSLFTDIAGLVIGYIDTLMLTYFLTLDKVGIYNAVLPTALIIVNFSGAVYTVFFPMVSELWEKKLREKLKNAITLIYRYLLVLTIPFVLILFAYSKTILRLLFGEAYVPGFLAMMILALGVILISLAKVNFAFLSGIGKPAKVTKIMIVAAVFNVIFNLILIPIIGIEGAALTTTLSYALMLILSYLAIKKEAKITFPIKIFVKILLIALIFIGSIYLVKWLIADASIYIRIACSLGVALLIYVTLIFKLRIITWNDFKRLLYQSLPIDYLKRNR
ncbi:hypothetical protein AYK26_02180 [Euryarchaeota archaeon SM23-78]|nr:MAG: hypothetical protein AYK26_02180 [Euryarchaeota archaeon SM23-78]